MQIIRTITLQFYCGQTKKNPIIVRSHIRLIVQSYRERKQRKHPKNRLYLVIGADRVHAHRQLDWFLKIIFFFGKLLRLVILGNNQFRTVLPIFVLAHPGTLSGNRTNTFRYE